MFIAVELLFLVVMKLIILLSDWLCGKQSYFCCFRFRGFFVRMIFASKAKIGILLVGQNHLIGDTRNLFTVLRLACQVKQLICKKKKEEESFQVFEINLE